MASIGLVVVHGIGNQGAGVLCRQVADHLQDASRPDSAQSSDPSTRDDFACAADALSCTVIVHGRQVILREAHWSPLSDPGNPPQLRDALPTVLQFLETSKRALFTSPVARILRRLGIRSRSGVISVLAILGFAITSGFLVAWQVPSTAEPLLQALGIAMTIYGAYATYLILRRVWLAARRRSAADRVARIVASAPAAWVAGFSQLVLVMLAAEFMLFLAVAMALTFILGGPAKLAASGFRGLAAALRLPALRQWTHRLGWIVAVLPVHVLLQAVKSAGCLASVLVNTRSARVRVAAVAWFFGVYLGFALLLAFSEILILPLVVTLLPDFDTAPGQVSLTLGNRVAIALCVMLVYLLLVKLLLPVLDLVLDVANYHLANTTERIEYQARIAPAVTFLRSRGCQQVHILAHSLGSVITFDWLCAGDAASQGVTTLYTIGSPLNKFWYVDSDRGRQPQQVHANIELPIVAWFNFWAISDPVSGRLARYAHQRVAPIECRIARLGPPLVSHVNYWRDRTVLERIRSEIGKGSTDELL